ncbi:hypothetical protein H5U98_03210 [Mycolicibacterium boenickei]|uniref:Cell division protein FtsL n=2 Tax=Mycolicibacterium boenickei TaxID=146017 RepID=A0AAX2ZYD2_9MYCO|nr:hypothetical protein [Mycolicibacterium boenickei]UNC00471.1 hypothetical protein H5U98_03210 [Mycolicibacterium boenickei]
MRGDEAAMEFVARGRLPSTPEEWLGLLAAIGVMGATYVLVQIWAGRSVAKELDALEARLVAESSQFRNRWPAQLLWQAPYAELEAEAERSWRIVFVLGQRRDLARRGRGGDFDTQIAAVRSWITTVVNAMNVVASRGR